MDEALRRAERLSQLGADPAARERWEAERARLGGLRRIDLPIPFHARVIEDGERRDILGPTGRAQRVSAEARVSLRVLGELSALPDEPIPSLTVELGRGAELEALRGLRVDALTVALAESGQLDRLAGLPELRGLIVPGVSSSELGAASVFDRFREIGDLTRLRQRELCEVLLSGLRLRRFESRLPASPKILELLGAQPELEDLTLTLEPDALGALDALAALPLKTLSLRVTGAVASLAGLAAFEDRGGLLHLSLSGPFDPERSLALAQRCERLQGLELDLGGERSPPVLDLAPLGAIEGLRALRYRSSAPQARRLRGLGALAGLRHLSVQELSPEAPDRPLEGLASLRLRTGSLRVARAQLALLDAAPELRRLDLTLPDAGLSELVPRAARLPSLTRLKLRTTEGICLSAALREAFAGCELEVFSSDPPFEVNEEQLAAAYQRSGVRIIDEPTRAWDLTLRGEEGHRSDAEVLAEASEPWRAELLPRRFELLPRLLGLGEEARAWSLAEAIAAAHPCAELVGALAFAFARAGAPARVEALLKERPWVWPDARAHIAAALGQVEAARAAAAEALDDPLRWLSPDGPVAARLTEMRRIAETGRLEEAGG